MSFSILSSNIALGNANVASHLVQVSNSALTVSRADAHPVAMTVIGNITASGLTASRVVTSDASTQLVSSPVTGTELGYVQGTTSNIQTQLNAKAELGYVQGTTSNIQTQLNAKAAAAHTHDAANITSGTLTVARGGTGVTTSTGTGNVVLSTSPKLQNDITIQGTSPIIVLQDTDHNSAMIHCNGNFLYVLRGENNSTASIPINGQWPMYINLTNNDATFGGSVAAINNVTAYASDERLKTNVTPIENALEKVRTINGVSFDWDDGGPQPMRGHDVGLIAQDVSAVLPEAVCPAPFDVDEKGNSKSGQNYLTIDFGNKLTALLVEALKELSVKVDTLETKLHLLSQK